MTQIVILAVFISSLAYILGGFLVLFQKNWAERTLLSFVALSAGLLLAIALLDLIPDAQQISENSSLFVLIGFVLMYIIFLPKKTNSNTPVTGFTIAMLLHNFFEGLSIGISYSAKYELGIIVTIALVIHKIPEGLSYTSAMLAFLNGRRKTAFYLIIQGIFTWLGAFGTVILLDFTNFQEQIVAAGLSITAGIFLYLSGILLLPSINQGTFKSIPFYFLIGIFLYYLLHITTQALSGI